uniref:Uncharacterized protein n=1 Tax=Tetraselmis sp. GSL018 TaxID=582737 RepID=A0A061RZD4_9CHLO
MAERSSANDKHTWRYDELPRLNAAATAIQRRHRGRKGRRRFEDHCRRLLRAADLELETGLAGERKRRVPIRDAVSATGYSEAQMATVLRRACRELDSELKGARQRLQAMEDQVNELRTANDGLREANKQLEELSEVRAELISTKELLRATSQENRHLRSSLSEFKPVNASIGGPMLSTAQTVACAKRRDDGQSDKCDGSSEVDEWASMATAPESPVLGHLGGPIMLNRPPAYHDTKE